MSVMTIKLSKAEGTPWGFRLQGGKDFATPLCVQKVNSGSVAASAGLQAGDAIVQIGGKDALSLRHKEAQEAILKAGNSFELVVQRGGKAWKPSVTPLAEVKTTPDGVPVVTSTSLAANKQPIRHIGSNHNTTARPFPGFTGSQPKYSLGAPITFTSLGKDGPDTSFSGTSSRSTSGSTSPSCGIPVAGTSVSLSKENAKNFLMMTLDKENLNVNSNSSKTNKTNSNGLFSSQFLNNNGAVAGTVGHQRKYSLGSNASTCSSNDTDHEALTRRNNEVNGKQIVNAQYNTPLNLYSEENIAETLSAQAEVIGKGCLGINFKKYQRETVIQVNSPTYKLIHGDMEDTPKPRPPPASPFDKANQPPPPVASFQRVKGPMPPTPQAPAAAPVKASPAPEPQPPKQGGDSGYYNINEKLYCDVHAKQAARHNPPAPNMEPVVVKPGAVPPAGAVTANAAKPAPAPAPAPEPAPVVEPEPAPAPVPEPVVEAAPAPEPVQAAPEPAPAPEGQTSEYASEASVEHEEEPALSREVGILPELASEAESNLGEVSKADDTLTPETEKDLDYDANSDIKESENDNDGVPSSETIPESDAVPVSEVAPPSPEIEPSLETAQEPLPIIEDVPITVEESETAVEETEVPGALETPQASPEPVPAVPLQEPAPAPAPAPAPVPVQVPVAPMAAPPPTFAPAAPAPQLQFGAPAGAINVRSHIPKKGPAPASSMPKPTPIPDIGADVSAKGVQPPGQRTAPRRGRGVMNQAASARIPVCSDCMRQIRGPFVSALGKTWCPDHFVCSTETCRKPLIDMGFVEEQGSLHCEDCYEQYFAPICGKCDKRVKGDCLNAVGKQFHPECFCCAYCGKVFGSGAFYLEDGLPYCEADWNDLFTTKCVGCGFPIEAGDRWVEALNNNYHSQCFKCSKCNKNLEGQSFFAKGGKPFCKAHAQRGV